MVEIVWHQMANGENESQPVIYDKAGLIDAKENYEVSCIW